MAPAKLKKVGSEARCAVNKEGSQATSMQLLPFVPWALCFLLGPIVGHTEPELQRRAVAHVSQHERHARSTWALNDQVKFPAQFLPRAAMTTFASSFPQRHPIA